MLKKNKWALLIGIDKYHESIGQLKYACADCRELKRILMSPPFDFPEDQILLLSDNQKPDLRPTFGNIQSYLGKWLALQREEDIVVVFFSGHGRLLDNGTILVPSDASSASLHTMGIPLKQVQESIERCKAGQKVLFMDACHSGAGKDVDVMKERTQEELSRGKGFYTISSCSSEEVSHEWHEKKHGVFTYYLTEALKGSVKPDADGKLIIDNVYNWVFSQVTKWAAQNKCAQTPMRFASGSGSISLIDVKVKSKNELEMNDDVQEPENLFFGLNSVADKYKVMVKQMRERASISLSWIGQTENVTQEDKENAKKAKYREQADRIAQKTAVLREKKQKQDERAEIIREIRDRRAEMVEAKREINYRWQPYINIGYVIILIFYSVLALYFLGFSLVNVFTKNHLLNWTVFFPAIDALLIFVAGFFTPLIALLAVGSAVMTFFVLRNGLELSYFFFWFSIVVPWLTTLLIFIATDETGIINYWDDMGLRLW